MTDMNDERLDELLDDAKRTWRVPPAPPVDDIWMRVERDAFVAPARRGVPRWGGYAAAIAASLIIGVIGGRLSITPNGAMSPVADGGAARTPQGTTVTPVASNDPYQRTTEQFLGRTAVLLASLPGDARTIDANTKLAGQAVQLLTTTRLLLDSPVAKDRRMKELLEDLELVLAQVARMQTPRHRDELVLINEALAERDLVPRIRSAVADLSMTQ